MIKLTDVAKKLVYLQQQFLESLIIEDIYQMQPK